MANDGVMPEDSFKIKNIHYGIMNGDGSYKHIGEVGESVSLTVDGNGISSRSYYHELMTDLSGTISFKIPWWQRNRVLRVLGCRAPYHVASLRRGGKSHKGKEMRCHAT